MFVTVELYCDISPATIPHHLKHGLVIEQEIDHRMNHLPVIQAVLPHPCPIGHYPFGDPCYIHHAISTGVGLYESGMI